MGTSVRFPRRFGGRHSAAVNLDFVQRHHRVTSAGSQVESEAVAGADAAGEFSGSDPLAVHMKTLAAGADGGNDVMPPVVVELSCRVKWIVTQECKTQ